MARPWPSLELASAERAQGSQYGLSGTVWSVDTDRAFDIAKQVRTGTLSINGFMLDFSCPFGGFKQSGMGRELGPEGLEHYLELKTISFPSGRTEAIGS